MSDTEHSGPGPVAPAAPPRSSSPRLFVVSTLALAALLALLGRSLPAQPAQPAQEVHLVALTGETLSDSDLAKGTTIIVAWASWSPRSQDVVARVKPLAAHWHAQARVCTLDFEEDGATVRAFLAGKEMGVPVFLDSDGMFSKKYAIATLPGLLVVKEGRVAYHGKLPEDPDPVITQALR